MFVKTRVGGRVLPNLIHGPKGAVNERHNLKQFDLKVKRRILFLIGVDMIKLGRVL